MNLNLKLLKDTWLSRWFFGSCYGVEYVRQDVDLPREMLSCVRHIVIPLGEIEITARLVNDASVSLGTGTITVQCEYTAENDHEFARCERVISQSGQWTKKA